MNNNSSNSKVCQTIWHTFFREFRKKLFLWITLVTVSCTIEIPFDMEGIDKQLVVNSVFSTHKPIVFHFSHTESPVLPAENIQDSLHLMLYENDVMVLDTNVFSNELLTSFFPQPKNSYTIEVLCKRYNHSSPAVTMRYLGIEDKEVHGVLMNDI